MACKKVGHICRCNMPLTPRYAPHNHVGSSCLQATPTRKHSTHQEAQRRAGYGNTLNRLHSDKHIEGRRRSIDLPTIRGRCHPRANSTTSNPQVGDPLEGSRSYPWKALTLLCLGKNLTSPSLKHICDATNQQLLEDNLHAEEVSINAGKPFRFGMLLGEKLPKGLPHTPQTKVRIFGWCTPQMVFPRFCLRCPH